MDSSPVGFPSTLWTQVREAGDGARGQDAKEALLRRYWKPVYWFVRLTGGYDASTALDVTQGFFVKVLEGKLVERADPMRGSFRSYLKTSLRHFLIDQARAESARRKTGRTVQLSLEEAEAGAAELVAAGKEFTPEQVFEREWVAAVVRAAVAETERKLRTEGKEAYVDAFRLHDLEGGRSYREVAERLGRSEDDVRNYLRVARDLFRDCVRAEVRETVGNIDDLGSEMAELFGWLK